MTFQEVDPMDLTALDPKCEQCMKLSSETHFSISPTPFSERLPIKLWC